MAKSATEIIQDVINASVVDAIVALKGASQGLPNALLRDLNAIHANTAFGDLPPAVQKAVSTSVRDAFARLQREGYVVAEDRSVQPSKPRPPGTTVPDRHAPDREPFRQRRGPPKPGGSPKRGGRPRPGAPGGGSNRRS